MPRITADHWNAAAIRLNDMLPPDTEDDLMRIVCEIRADDPDRESGPDCQHKHDKDSADEAHAVAEILASRGVHPSLAALFGACLSASLPPFERWLSVTKDTDETLSEWARRLVDTGSGATAKDAEPNADEMLLTVAHWTEHGDPSQPMPEDASDAVERLLILGYGPKWADACAKAVGR